MVLSMKLQGKTEKAQGLVEFALVLPILLLISMGIVEFGRLLFIYSALNSASSEAVRYGSAVDDTSGQPQFADCTGIQSAATGVGSLVNLTSVTISYDEGPGAPVIASDCSALTAADIEDIVGGRDRVVVQVQAFYEPIVPLVNIPGFTLSAESVRTIVKDIDLGVGGAPGAGGGGGGGGGATPSVVFTASSQSANEDAGSISIGLQLSATATSVVTVPLTVSGTASNGVDYTITPISATIGVGSDTATITVIIADDAVYENDETIIVEMGTPVNATTGTPDTHIVTIVDNDTEPTASFSSASQSGNEDVGALVFQAQLDVAAGVDVEIPFSLGGTATTGADYSITASPVTIPAGAMSVNITITVTDDSLDEEDAETVIITMGTPTNAAKGSPSVHTATINDNDDPPSVFFALATQSGPESAGLMSISVELSTPSGRAVSVPFSLGGTATNGSDYSVVNASPLVITAGSPSADIVISLVDDGLIEGDETVIFTLGTPTNASLGALTTHTATIVEVADPPTVKFTNVSQTSPEGTSEIHVSIELNYAWGDAVTIPFALSGTATAGAGNDYSVAASPVNIPAGSQFANLIITVYNDTLDENNETVIITMGTPTNATKGSPSVHTATITDNDDPPVVSFDLTTQSVSEAVGAVTFHAQLSTLSGKTVTVPFSVTGGSATQGAGNDYVITTSPVTILAGSPSADITITINNDATAESDETVEVTLGSPTNATAATAPNNQYTLTIQDNDSCSISAPPPTRAGDTVTWYITNDSSFTITLTDLYINWDNGGGQDLNSITLNGNTINYKDTAPPTDLPTDNAFVGPVANRQLVAGNTATIVFNFKNSPTSGYNVSARFDNDNACKEDDSY